MNITSWNVNGIRAVHRKELFVPMLEQVHPDVLLLQETKSEEGQLSNELKTAGGYTSHFNSSNTRKGYSGVAIYTKETPKEVTRGMGTPAYDQEGRVITAFFDHLTVCNIYFPNGGGGPERLQYKLEFYDVFLEYVARLKKHNPVIWGGDINTAHHPIDLARPKENEKNTGFLPEERAWLDEVEAQGWIDTFRHFHPNKRDAYTYWDMKTRARERNVGWRIDYLFVSSTLAHKLKTATIHANILGSDHCPISVEVGM
jgi:exodeoxyribonuclease III